MSLWIWSSSPNKLVKYSIDSNSSFPLVTSNNMNFYLVFVTAVQQPSEGALQMQIEEIELIL